MLKSPLKSPNDSLQQASTAYVSTRRDEYSLDTSSFQTQKGIGGGAHIGGGSMKSYMLDHLDRLHGDIEGTTRKCELEQRRLFRLDKELETAEHEYQTKQKKFQQAASAQSDAVQKKALEVRTMEKRLEKAIAALNQSASENEVLREQIDQLRKERKAIMNPVFKNLERGIQGNMKQLDRIGSSLNEEKVAGEEAATKAKALNKMLERERRSFHKVTEQVRKDITEEGSIQREQERGAQERANASAAKGKKKRNYMVADEEEAFSEERMHRRILKLSFLNTIQRRHIKQHQKNIEVFEQAFATIKSTTGISDIEEIVKIFVGLEQRNFSLLNYVNTLNREIESFEKQNNELESQLEAQSSAENESDKRRNLALTDLNSQIDSMAGVTEENQVQATHHLEILDRCKPLVQTILKAVEKENRGFGGQPAPERAAAGDNVLAWLTYIEKTLTQWKDFLPESKADARNFKQANKNYKYTVGNQVLGLQAKKHDKNLPLVRPLELPSAANAFVEQGAQQRSAAAAREDESSDEEEDHHHPWTRQELRDKAVASVAKRKKHRKVEVQGAQPASQLQSGADQLQRADAAAEKAAEEGGELGYEDLVEKTAKGDGDDDSMGSDDSEDLDEVGPSEEEINEIFLKRYKMSKEELQGMADKMGIQLNNLCYLKQEFDAYDEDRSGYIDVKELKGLLEKLGEELSDEELDQAFKELDSDNSGDIEFFEFVEWFTSED
mmetsp:Transcript_61515/g.180487  ORF Transcript_61515/g.180487 Transcript_61515/m.180487 type:complete len:726 (-) Transcript_61515:60-2237(-)